MHRPFLPYKNKDEVLIFPTGKFVGTYFSEKLKYAKSIGYRVFPGICLRRNTSYSIASLTTLIHPELKLRLRVMNHFLLFINL